MGNEPKVIEYNVRMGDPETEVVIPRIESDLVELLAAMGSQNLGNCELKISDLAATTVMAVSGGYPESYQKGKEITGLDAVEDVTVFHAGTRLEGDKVLSNGGRVMAVTAMGADYKQALKKSYQNIAKLHFDTMQYRSDIGFDLA